MTEHKAGRKALPTLLTAVLVGAIGFYLMSDRQPMVTVGLAFSPVVPEGVLAVLSIGNAHSVFDVKESPWTRGPFPVRRGALVQIAASRNPGELGCVIRIDGALMAHSSASLTANEKRVLCDAVVP